MQEIKTITGQIYSVSKDKKSISILGEWYHSFHPTIFNKSDNVKLTYVENKKGDKTFKNIKSIETIKTENQNNEPTIEQKDNFKEYKDDKTAVMMTSYVKDIAVAYINNVKSYEDLNYVTKQATESLLASYKQIKSNL